VELPAPTHEWSDRPQPAPVRGHGKVTSMYSVSTTVYEDGCTVTRLGRLDLTSRRWVTEDLGEEEATGPSRTAALERIGHAVLDVLLAEGSEAG